jgi:hypothetical protein
MIEREGLRRPRLDKAINVSGTGDVLGSAEWDRVAGSMLDTIKINDRTRGARLPISWRHSAAERPLPMHWSVPQGQLLFLGC